MKWNDLPWWLKAIIITIGVIFIYHVIKLIIEYVQNNKNEWYRKWLVKQNEIRELIKEKERIIKLIKRAALYARLTLISLKFILFFAFIAFTNYLMLKYKMDVFTAIASSGGTVVTTYSIVAFLFNQRIRGLNEIHELTCEKLQHLFQKQLNIEPIRINDIDVKLEILRKEACLLKENLRS